MDFVKRKIRFDKDVTDSAHVISDMEEDDTENMKLKRLFKSRAKKLMERAESLTSNQFELIPDYKFGSSDEEEKEIKLLQHKVPEPKLENRHRLHSSLSASNFTPLLDPPMPSLIEDAKDSPLAKHPDPNSEEFKKFREEIEANHPAHPAHNKLCGKKRTKSFSNKEEFERSLKDFT